MSAITSAGRRPGAGGRRSATGFTLIELVIVVAIIGILAAAVLPLAHWSVKRQEEYELQENLRILRNAIDRYHDLAAAGMIQVGPGDSGYPPDLDVLVEGIELTGELPSPVPGVSGAFSATGEGLTGGAGAQMQGQGGGFGGGAQGGGFGIGGQGGAAGNRAQSGMGGFGSFGGTGQRRGQSLSDAVRSRLGGQRRGGGGLSRGGNGAGQQMGGQLSLGSRGGAGRGGSGFGGSFGSSFGTSLADRNNQRSPGETPKIVLLRRIPVDPFTGKAEWGMRCYGEKLEDRSWCGRDVFDVFSKALGNGIDGRPYREW